MIKIMVDSSADRRRDVDFMVPLTVSIGGRDYADGVDLDSDRFYQLLVASEEFPKTAQPSPEAFCAFFEQVKEAGDELLYFALSSTLSGTFQSASIAKSLVEYDGIHIIDTRGATHMIGLLVDHALTQIRAGVSAATIVVACEELKGRIRVVAGVDTLEYLYKGGRLSRTSAAVGALAGIKPVVMIEDGQVKSIGKCLGRPRAMQFLQKWVSERAIDPAFPVYSLYTCGEENCAALEWHLNACGVTVTERLQVGSTIGAHIGPGLYGVMFVEK